MQHTRKEITAQYARLTPLHACLSCQIQPSLEVKNNTFSFYCGQCGFHTSAFDELQPAATDWHRSNRPGSTYIAEAWAHRFERTGIHDKVLSKQVAA